MTGCRVLDSSGPMGVYCGKRITDIGTDVIKVEWPLEHSTRRIGPFIYGRKYPELNLYRLHFNTDKRSIKTGYTSAEGRAPPAARAW